MTMTSVQNAKTKNWRRNAMTKKMKAEKMTMTMKMKMKRMMNAMTKEEEAAAGAMYLRMSWAPETEKKELVEPGWTDRKGTRRFETCRLWKRTGPKVQTRA